MNSDLYQTTSFTVYFVWRERETQIFGNLTVEESSTELMFMNLALHSYVYLTKCKISTMLYSRIWPFFIFKLVFYGHSIWFFFLHVNVPFPKWKVLEQFKNVITFSLINLWTTSSAIPLSENLSYFNFNSEMDLIKQTEINVH